MRAKTYVAVVAILTILLISPWKIFAGKYAADFLRIGVGSRASALGGAYIALANDATAFYWNPAGLAQISKFQVHFGHTPLFDGLAQYNFADLGVNMGKFAVAVAWIRMGVDDIPRYPELQGARSDRMINSHYRSTGEAEGFFKDTEDAVFFSVTRRVPFTIDMDGGFAPASLPTEFSVGATIKYLRHQLDDATATGQGIDFGALIRFFSRTKYHRQPKRWLSLGVSARDVSRTTLQWNTRNNTKDRVDLNFVGGLAYSQAIQPVRTRFTILFDQEFGVVEESHVGLEVELLHTLALRSGLENDDLTLGAGIRILGLTIDYAFTAHELGNSHKISGSISF